MHFLIYTSEPVKDQHIRALEDDYLRRMRGWAPVQLVTKQGSRSDRSQNIRAGVGLRTGLPPSSRGGYIVLLDEAGVSKTSREFSLLLERSMQMGSRDTIFAIGPADGWSSSHREEADIILSLSPLTFPHQLVRLLLIEQIYRGMTMIQGKPYHRD
jgi:23S rRNA (pseudouridine1915-N3)-methyltransferase